MVTGSSAKVLNSPSDFWITKILATTLGETGGDPVTMTWLHADQNAHNGGYIIGTGILLAVFVAAVVAQSQRNDLTPEPQSRGRLAADQGKYSFTVEEAARALNLHRNTVRNWVRRGGLPYHDRIATASSHV